MLTLHFRRLSKTFQTLYLHVRLSNLLSHYQIRWPKLRVRLFDLFNLLIIVSDSLLSPNKRVKVRENIKDIVHNIVICLNKIMSLFLSSLIVLHLNHLKRDKLSHFQ